MWPSSQSNRFNVEKLTVVKWVNKVPSIWGAGAKKCITVVTSVRHSTLNWAQKTHFTHWHDISLRTYMTYLWNQAKVNMLASLIHTFLQNVCWRLFLSPDPSSLRYNALSSNTWQQVFGEERKLRRSVVCHPLQQPSPSPLHFHTISTVLLANKSCKIFISTSQIWLGSLEERSCVSHD